MKKVLFLATRPIFPMKDGRTYLLGQYCQQMCEDMGLEVYFACFDYDTQFAQPDYLNEVKSLSGPRILEILFNVIIRTLILRWPFQASMMYSKSSQKKLNEYVRIVEPDIIICDMVRTAPYVVNYSKIIRILDMDDLLSKRYKRQAKMNNVGINVIGQYKKNIPIFLLDFVERFRLIPTFLKYEAKLMESFEVRIAARFDKVFFCSPIDKEEYNFKSKIKAECVRVAVQQSDKSNLIGVKYDENCIVYLGNIDVSANKDTLHFLAGNILPELISADKEMHLLVVGNCSTKTRDEFVQYSNVHFTFRVEDILPYITKCLCLVAPIQYGSGIKIKILECMSCGVPVITNGYGTEGLQVENMKNIMICETTDDYVQSVLKLKRIPELRKEIVHEAGKYIKENHSKAVSLEDLKQVVLGDSCD